MLKPLKGVAVDVLSSESSVSGEVDTGSESSPVTLLTPSSGRRISTRGVFVATDSTSGEITVKFPTSNILLGKIYCSKFESLAIPEIQFLGDVDESIQMEWTGTSVGAKIFWTIRYKEELE